jgi:hypothetical protein
MTLTASGPITSSAAGQVIQNKSITVTDQDAITILHDNVRVFNCLIRHGVTGMDKTSRGIYAAGVKNPDIQQCDVAQTISLLNGSQSRSPNADNILFDGVSSDPSAPGPNGNVKARIRGVRCSRGSRLIKITQSTGGWLIANFEGHRVCGLDEAVSPDDYGGNAFQADNSPGGTLQDFSYEAADAGTTAMNQSWTEDLISILGSNDVVVQRGFAQWCNSPTGMNFLAEASTNVKFIDCDATRMSNGAFGFSNGGDGSLTRCRAKNGSNVGYDGRGAPSSDGLMIEARGPGMAVFVTPFDYFDPANPNNLLWEEQFMTNPVLRKLTAQFAPQPTQRVTLPS